MDDPSAAVPAAPTSPAAPAVPSAIDPYRRIVALDVLRGVAIFGILVMNIRNFALPLRDFQRPSVAGGLGVANVASWFGANVVFEDKMIALLSLLFGAGLVLMDAHARERGVGFARRWYLRCAWLLVFGVVHAIAVWYGDILNTYAAAGLLLFPVRKLSPKKLAWLGVIVLLIPIAVSNGPQLWKLVNGTLETGPVESIRAQLERPVPPPDAAPPLPPADDAVALNGSYADAVRWHWKIFFAWHVEGAYAFNLWRCMGLMLFGMALAKVGFFEGGAAKLRRRLLAVGYGIGLPLALAVTTTFLFREFRRAHVEMGFEHTRLAWPLFLSRPLQYASGILMGLGHAALLVAWCQRSRSSFLLPRLADAGRMALTHYLVQSLICTFLFYGWGLGLFGELSFVQLTGVVAAIVVVQLLVSPWWLARFTMGPFEWCWRSLTLGKRLPFKRSGAMRLD